MIKLDKLKNPLSIKGKLVILKTFTEENITDEYLSWLNDYAVVQYSNQRFKKHTYETSSDYLKSFSNTENLFFAIYLKDLHRYVGTMSVYVSSAHQTADIGIMVGDKSCWGRGVGGDAWNIILTWLIDVVKIRKVTGGTLSCNANMVKIMIKAGMKPDGIRLGHELVENKAKDVVYFAKFNSIKMS